MGKQELYCVYLPFLVTGVNYKRPLTLRGQRFRGTLEVEHTYIACCYDGCSSNNRHQMLRILLGPIPQQHTISPKVPTGTFQLSHKCRLGCTKPHLRAYILCRYMYISDLPGRLDKVYFVLHAKYKVRYFVMDFTTSRGEPFDPQHWSRQDTDIITHSPVDLVIVLLFLSPSHSLSPSLSLLSAVTPFICPWSAAAMAGSSALPSF